MTDYATKVPWADEDDPANKEAWGWLDETPHRIATDGPDDAGNIPTPVFDIMWVRNPANRHEMEDINAPDPAFTFGRWLLWDDIEIAREELAIAVKLHEEGK